MRNKPKIKPVLAAVLLAAAGICAAQGPEGSTAAAVGEQSPLLLNISKNARESRIGLDYAIRWDFKDLSSFRPDLGAIYSGVKAVYSWDITENTRVNYYGLRTNPWRVIITKEKKSGPGEAGGTAAGGLVKGGASSYQRHIRFSVSPLVDDIKRNFYDNLSEFLLRSSLKGVSPEWEKAGSSVRKDFVKDVLTLDIWGAPVPGVSETKKGLEYLSRGETEPVGVFPEPFAISTRPAAGNR